MGLILAQKFNCPILSIDSVQIYRNMDIGSAKPNRLEKSQVLHEMVDIVDPQQYFNVAKFVTLAESAYDRHSGKILGVGGTPFYINALQDGLTQIDVQPQFENYLKTLSIKELSDFLYKNDPERAAAISVNDRFRLERALAIVLSTGKKPSSFLKSTLEKRAKLNLYALRCDRALMHQRLKQRLEGMFEAGLLEEAHALYKLNHLSKTAKAAVGYKELFQYFDGNWSLDTAKEKILIATRRLFKHQMTWLNKMNVNWIDVHPEEVELALPSLDIAMQQHFEALATDDV